MSKVIICANQKGGVAKSTSVVNIGIGLARLGKKVLVIDNDPQGSLTEALGYPQPDKIEITLATIMEWVLNEEEFDRAINLQSMENHGFIKGWGSYLSRTNEINAPTLVIHGTEDTIIPYEHGIHLSEVIPNAVLVTLEGTGHELHHNDWDEIINAISKHATNL